MLSDALPNSNCLRFKIVSFQSRNAKDLVPTHKNRRITLCAKIIAYLAKVDSKNSKEPLAKKMKIEQTFTPMSAAYCEW
jgi:hypothetical protein